MHFPLILALALAGALSSPAYAQRIQVVPDCAGIDAPTTQEGRLLVDKAGQLCTSSLPMPFMRSGDPYLLPAATTAQQYQITQPAKAKSYRFVNPCGVDIRVKSVGTMSATVSATTGTRFLARTIETLGSTPNPLNGSMRIVSIMTMGDPGPGGCTAELQYGNGG